MQISLSLADIFRNVWGVSPNDEFYGKFKNISGDGNIADNTMGQYGSLYYQDDNPLIYLPIQVIVGNDPIPTTPGTTYAEQFGQPDGKWWLPYPVLSWDLKVHVVDTELTERDGMVSELINVSGYKINIKGLLVNDDSNEFPETDYDTLLRLVNLKTPFKINNPATDILFMRSGNTAKTVTVRGLQFPGKEGVKHVKAYELELMSEMPFSLIEVSS